MILIWLRNTRPDSLHPPLFDNVLPVINNFLQSGKKLDRRFAGAPEADAGVEDGANFPKPVWESNKAFYDRVYVLVKESKDGTTAYRWVSGFQLERPIAYGASVSPPPHGIVCMGGNDAAQTYTDVFRLCWNPKSETIERQSLPSLPEPCTNAGAAVIGEKIYVAGGSTGLGLETAQSNFWSLDLSHLESGNLAWEQLPSWPGPARVFVIAAAQNNGVNDCVYVISGGRPTSERGKLLEKLRLY